MSKPAKPCENCGSSSWTHGTPIESRGVLTPVVVAPDDALDFRPNAGTPADVWICEGCGMLRLFTVIR